MIRETSKRGDLNQARAVFPVNFQGADDCGNFCAAVAVEIGDGHRIEPAVWHADGRRLRTDRQDAILGLDQYETCAAVDLADYSEYRLWFVCRQLDEPRHPILEHFVVGKLQREHTATTHGGDQGCGSTSAEREQGDQWKQGAVQIHGASRLDKQKMSRP